MMRHTSTYNNIVHDRLVALAGYCYYPFAILCLASDLIKGNEHDRIASRNKIPSPGVFSSPFLMSDRFSPEEGKRIFLAQIYLYMNEIANVSARWFNLFKGQSKVYGFLLRLDSRTRNVFLMSYYMERIKS